jgi:hypothetical protein
VIDKPYPPWKYWTISSLAETLKKVFNDLGEEAKKNIQSILSNHDCVQKITELNFSIGKNAPLCTLTIEFLHRDLQKQDSGSDWISLIKKAQFNILKDISTSLVTTSLKPDVKMTTICSSGELTSWTCWECITKISGGGKKYKDWDLTAVFSYKLNW